MWDLFKTSNMRVSIVDALRALVNKSKEVVFFFIYKKLL